jgi:flagellar protein FlaG
MDAALSYRAMYPQPPAMPRAEAAIPVRHAVPTELPQPDKSVAAAVEHSAADGTAARPRANAELPRRLSDEVLREIEREVEREVEFNRDAKTLVFTKRDGSSGQVLQQIPDERLLKMRAYVAQTLDQPAVEPVVERDA